MGSLNSVTLIGRLGADPEVRQAGATTVCNLRIATSEKRKGEEKTEWHNVTVFGETAEACAKFLVKGRELCVQGRLQMREWTDKAGNKRFSTDVVADRVVFLGSKGESGGTGQTKPSAPDDDVPF